MTFIYIFEKFLKSKSIKINNFSRNLYLMTTRYHQNKRIYKKKNFLNQADN